MAVESHAAGGRTFPRLHWSAVIAGVLLALAAHIVMGLVGATLGFAAEPADSRGVGAAAAIWALLTPFVATLLGAWLACRMAGDDDRRSAGVHGVLVWCIGLIAGALFLTGTMATGAMSAGAAASGNLRAAQRTMGAGTGAARGDTGAARPGTRAAEARQDEAARRAAAGTGGAALGAIAGLLGAIVAAGIATSRREGRGMGWPLGARRREEARAGGRTGEERYASTTTTTSYEPGTRVPPTPSGAPPELGGPPRDPYHH
jgi:hypothetical protein